MAKTEYTVENAENGQKSTKVLKGVLVIVSLVALCLTGVLCFMVVKDELKDGKNTPTTTAAGVTTPTPASSSHAPFTGFTKSSTTKKTSDVTSVPVTTASPTVKPVLRAKNGEIFPYDNIRLPGQVSPSYYKIKIQTNMTDFSFGGIVIMTIETSAPTDVIVFHSMDLELPETPTLQRVNSSEIKIVKFLQNLDHQQVYLKLEEDLQVGTTYTLQVKFEGILSTSYHGYYRSRYTDNQGNTKYIATTQFESTDSRRAFPCFDEPQLKAVFSITMIVPEGLQALGNNEVKSNSTLLNGLTKYEFHDSPKMSSYLVAFIVHDFGYVQGVTARGIRMRVFAPNPQVQFLDFSLEVAINVIDYYEKFYGVNFPLPKMDAICIRDFAAGAMENWGLVTFRESAILYDPLTSTYSQKKWIASVIAHEFAHQWFGDLVTMKWWNDIWLNEGFASFVQYYGVNNYKPEWRMMDQFLTNHVNIALRKDCFTNSHPIQVDVKDPDEISDMFDTISYKKGASVNRMIQAFMGEQRLQAGLQHYLNKHKFSNAVTNDLWDALSSQMDNVDVKKVMNTWTNQMGYPLVKVEKDKNGLITTSQSRFLLDADFPWKTNFVSPYGYKWHIPMVYYTNVNNNSTLEWMSTNADRQFSCGANGQKVDWILVNRNHGGFYRVNYDERNWKALSDQLLKDHQVFSPSDRTGLLDDVFTLLKTGDVNVNTAMTLAKYLENELDFLPWEQFTWHCYDLERYLRHTPQQLNSFKSWVRTSIAGALKTISWQQHLPMVELKRRRIIFNLAIRYCSVDIEEKLFQLYKTYLKTGKIDPNIRQFAIQAAAKIGGESNYKAMLKAFFSTHSYTLKKEMLKALVNIEDARLLKFAILSIVSKSNAYYTYYCFRYASGNTQHSDLVWTLFQQRYVKISNKFQASDTARLVEYMSVNFDSSAKLTELKTFFKKHPKLPYKKYALNNVRLNVQWMRFNIAQLINYINKNMDHDTTTQQTTTMPEITTTESPLIATNGELFPYNNIRLPSSLVPVRYDIEIKPAMDNFTYLGSVEIKILVKKSTDVIVLHSLGLEFHSKSLTDSAGMYNIVKFLLNIKHEQLYIRLDRPVSAGEHVTLFLTFSGYIIKSNKGFYRSGYLDEQGQEKFIATTHFEPNGARTAIPCFDEPQLKAVFSMAITKPKTKFAQFNTDVESISEYSESQDTHLFKDTRIMSTYLLAFMVHDFPHIEHRTASGMKVRFYGPAAQMHLYTFAAEMCYKVVDHLEMTLGLKFPNDKLDAIAVRDFSAGAMENMGMIVFRDDTVTYDNETDFFRTRQWAAAVIAHEISHQYFGDLVTMKWWNEIWLNEGLATFMEFYIMKHVKPDFHTMEQFLNHDFERVLNRDSFSDSHPIVTDVANYDQIRSLFDMISYSKGSSIMRMLYYTMSEEKFFGSLHDYLSKNSYKNTNSDDMWNAFSNKTGIDIKTKMNSWLLQMGVPQVTVTMDDNVNNNNDNDNNYLVAKQSRFLYDKENENSTRFTSPYGYVWHIPLVYFTDKQPKKTLLWYNSKQVQIDIGECDWYILNSDHGGFYRVLYPTENYVKLAKYIVDNADNPNSLITNSDRSGLLNDVFAQAKSGDIAADVWLTMLDTMRVERSYLAWEVAPVQLKFIGDLVKSTPAEHIFQIWVQSLIEQRTKELKLHQATHIEQKMRYEVISIAIRFNYQPVIDRIAKLYSELNSTGHIQPDLRVYAYTSAVLNGRGADIWSRFIAPGVGMFEQRRVIQAMVHEPEDFRFNTLLLYSIDPSRMSSHLMYYVLMYASEIPQRKSAVLNFVAKHYKTIEERMKTYRIKYLYDIVESVCSNYHTESKYNEIKATFASVDLSERSRQAVQAGLVNIRVNQKWIQNNLNNTLYWLHFNVKYDHSTTMPIGTTRLPIRTTKFPISTTPIFSTKLPNVLYDTKGHVFPYNNIRLPSVALPMSYHLFMSTDLIGLSFNGTVSIMIEIKEDTDFIVLHSYKLNIDAKPTLTEPRFPEEGDIMQKYQINLKHQQIYIKASRVLKKFHVVSLRFQFSANLSTGKAGYYRSPYTDMKGNTKYISTTQFEETDARTAFPCFDEPGIKSRFFFQSERSNDKYTLFNTAHVSTRPSGPNRSIDKFARTPKMSVYLIAFVVSDFKFVETRSNSGIKLRVFAPEAQINQTKLALKVCESVFNTYDSMFDASFPISKLDSIAIKSYAGGAMENWGLVTYKDTSLLFDKYSTYQQRHRVAYIIAHEFAHQWFGDLVTTKWWNDIWLNEGFASYIEDYGTDNYNKDWRMTERFVNNDMLGALTVDAMTTSRPLRMKESELQDYGSMFDTISYSKGACVLRMLESVMGKQKFFAGLNAYLQKYKYSNAVTNYFWEAIDSQMPTLNLKEIMNTWATQMGFPLVTVNVDHRGSQATISQQRFLTDEDHQKPSKYVSPYGYKWQIPVKYITNNDNSSKTKWLKNSNDSIDINSNGFKWIYVNQGRTAFFRVQYCDGNWQALAKQLSEDHSVFSAVDRCGILNDAMVLNRKTSLKGEILLNIMQYLNNETDFLPWETITPHLYMLEQSLQSAYKEPFKVIVMKMIEKAYNNIDWTEGIPYIKQNQRDVILQLAVRFGHEDALKHLYELFKKHSTDLDSMDPNLRSLAYEAACISVQENNHATRSLLYKFKKMYAYGNYEEKMRILKARSRMNGRGVIRKLLDETLAMPVYRAVQVYINIAENSLNRNQLNTFMKRNWNYQVKKIGVSYYYMNKFLQSVFGNFYEANRVAKATLTLTTSFMGGVNGQRAKQNVLETLADNAKWYSANNAALVKMITGKSIESTTMPTTTLITAKPVLHATNGEVFPYDNNRLPEYVLPSTYDISMATNFTDMTFNGTVKINIKSSKDTSFVVLHAGKKMDVYESPLISYNGETVLASKFLQQADRRQLYILFNDTFLANKEYTLTIRFRSQVGRGQSGYYRSRYTDMQGNTQYITTTQFEPVSARKAFPCFDEPSMKAVFKFSMERPNNRSTLFNTDLVKTSPGNHPSTSIDHFLPTLHMSTYLIAFVVHDFKYVEAEARSGLRVRVYAPEKQINQTRLALDVCTSVISHFESKQMLGIPFPMNKIDSVVIKDFAAGAMENWGLVTFRETALLFDDDQSTYHNRIRVASVIAHEFAHQWFGDLVTMNWWNDIWLNEGFASFIEYYGTDNFNKNWRMWEQFVNHDLKSALRTDSRSDSHPLTVSESEMPGFMFDGISYSKGSSVLRMLACIMGKDKLFTGLQQYLNKFKYGNSRTSDLWDVLSLQMPGIQLKQVMDTWSRQMGYPVVNVNAELSSSSIVSLSQNRFLTDADHLKPTKFTSPYGYKWEIPMKFFTNQQTSVKTKWLSNANDSLKLDGQGLKWIYANKDHCGFFRVQYSRSNWAALADQLKTDHSVFSPSDKAGLFNDAVALNSVGSLSSDIVLNLVDYLENELDFLPWQSVSSYLINVNQEMGGDYTYKFNLIMHNYLDKIFKTLKWERRISHIEQIKREVVLELGLKFGHQLTVRTLSAVFQNYKNRVLDMDPNLRQFSYTGAVLDTSNMGLFNDTTLVLGSMLIVGDAAEKVRVIKALSASNKLYIVNRLLQESLRMDPQLSVYVYIYVSRNNYYHDDLRRFIIKNWPILIKRNGFSKYRMSHLLNSAFGRINIHSKYLEAKKFLNSHSTGSNGEEAKTEVLKTMVENVKWKQANFEPIKTWIDNNPEFTITTEQPTTNSTISTGLIATNGEPFPYNNIMLPKIVSPVHYYIEIDTYVVNAKFGGNVSILLQVHNSTDTLVLHCLAMNVYPTITVRHFQTNELIEVTKFLINVKNQQIYIKLAEDLEIGEQYVLRIAFSARLQTKHGRGYYMSRIGTTSNFISVTQFEDTDARRAFPCFDEPEFKATFNMSMTRASDRISVFNTEIYHSENLKNHRVVDHYKTTVKMSVYLVAFAVCQHDVIQKTTSRGLKVRVFAPKNQINEFHFALDAAVTITEAFESKFNIKFPMSKIDLFAVDSMHGAMENYGLLTFSTKRIMYNSTKHGQDVARRVIQIIAHELAHQWFGDLVTMKWWSDLWLNEGLATYFSYIGVDKVNPDMRMREQFIVYDQDVALYHDSLLNTHPVHVPTPTRTEISSMFNKMTYSKAGSLLYMVEGFMGETRLITSLSQYLLNHKFANTVSNDMFDAFTEEMSGLNMAEVLNPWFLQSGYPVIDVCYMPGNTEITITQNRYYNNKTDQLTAEKSSNYIWPIPLVYISERYGEISKIIMNSRQMLQKVPSSRWILMNKDNKGFYRTRYCARHFLALVLQLEDDHTVFSPTEKVGLFKDTVKFVSRGDYPYVTILQAFNYLSSETDFLPWSYAKLHLAKLQRMFTGSVIEEEVYEWINKLIDGKIEDLDYSITAIYSDVKLRTALVYINRMMNNKRLNVIMATLYNIYNVTGEASNSLKLDLSIGAVRGAPPNFDVYTAMTSGVKVKGEKKIAMLGLSYSDDVNILERITKDMKTSQHVFKNDKHFTIKVLLSMCKTKTGQKFAFHFVRNNSDYIRELFKVDKSQLVNLYTNMTSFMKTTQEYKKAQIFLFETSNKSNNERKAASKALEILAADIKFIDDNKKDLLKFLSKDAK